MYLTKIELDTGARAVRAALADCQKMHRLLCGLFEESRQEAGLLYRLREDGNRCAVYLYSTVPVLPEKLLPFMHLSGQRDLTQWVASLRQGQRMGFDLITQPSKKVPQPDGGNSRRRAFPTEAERLAWLSRKAEQNGFALVSAAELAPCDFTGAHSARSGRMDWKAWHYRGVLEIRDAEAFSAALAAGIGPGKAYGMGMILLA